MLDLEDMNNRSRRTRYYTRRSKRPALIGTAAFASVIVLALGGLMLVGLDTVGSQGKQLARVAQPEVAQAPEVTEEESAGSGEETSGEEKSEEQASAGSAEESSRERSSDEKASDEKASEKASDEKGEEDRGPEKEEAEEPPPPQSDAMWMSIPRLGMQGDTVYNSSSHETMGVGAIKLPPTGFPWQDNANTYISAHRIGYPGTQSDNQFYALPAMQMNDVVYLGDANGTTYEYRVTSKFAVKPSENWVTAPQPGGDMVTLQTCIDSLDPSTWWDISPKLMRSGPDSARMIVQAEKVDTYPPS